VAPGYEVGAAPRLPKIHVEACGLANKAAEEAFAQAIKSTGLSRLAEIGFGRIEGIRDVQLLTSILLWDEA
jgi:hypothetical protein